MDIKFKGSIILIVLIAALYYTFPTYRAYQPGVDPQTVENKIDVEFGEGVEITFIDNTNLENFRVDDTVSTGVTTVYTDEQAISGNIIPGSPGSPATLKYRTPAGTGDYFDVTTNDLVTFGDAQVLNQVPDPNGASPNLYGKYGYVAQFSAIAPGGDYQFPFAEAWIYKAGGVGDSVWAGNSFPWNWNVGVNDNVGSIAFSGYADEGTTMQMSAYTSQGGPVFSANLTDTATAINNLPQGWFHFAIFLRNSNVFSFVNGQKLSESSISGTIDESVFRSIAQWRGCYNQYITQYGKAPTACQRLSFGNPYDAVSYTHLTLPTILLV